MTDTNLLQETIRTLEYHEKTVTDVQWVGSKDGEFAITWNEFAKIANVPYTCNYH